MLWESDVSTVQYVNQINRLFHIGATRTYSHWSMVIESLLPTVLTAGIAAPSEIFYHAQRVPVASFSAWQLVARRGTRSATRWRQPGSNGNWGTSNSIVRGEWPRTWKTRWNTMNLRTWDLFWSEAPGALAIAYTSQLFCATGTNDINSHDSTANSSSGQSPGSISLWLGDLILKIIKDLIYIYIYIKCILKYPEVSPNPKASVVTTAQNLDKRKTNIDKTINILERTRLCSYTNCTLEFFSKPRRQK